MINNSVIVKFWNDDLKIGFNDCKTAISLENSELVYYKSEVNNGVLRFRNKKKVIYYNKIKSNITHTNYKLTEILPF
jgi:hypothetical protein